MWKNLSHFLKTFIIKKQNSNFLKLHRSHPPPGMKFYSENTSSEIDNIDIVDINIDDMMNEDEDDDLASNYNFEAETKHENSGLNAYIAPMDIDPWSDEEFAQGGTINMEYVDKSQEEIHYPEPPKERSGYYEFEGIKIWLPKKMLTPATYRYRLEKGEDETLPDDIRICKFENLKPTT